MSTMNLEIKDGVHVLSLTNHDAENTFTLDVMHEYLAAFDEVEKYDGNTSLLICCDHEKTFSTGINLKWMMEQNPVGQKVFVQALETVLVRLALLSAPTIVAINGNAYAGGAILASSADFRLMRNDRGRLCFPEVDIKIAFTPIMSDIIDLLPNKQALKHLALTGKPFTGVECEANNIVDSTHSAEELMPAALELAKILGQKDRKTYTTIRNLLRPKLLKHATSLGLS